MIEDGDNYPNGGRNDGSPTGNEAGENKDKNNMIPRETPVKSVAKELKRSSLTGRQYRDYYFGKAHAAAAGHVVSQKRKLIKGGGGGGNIGEAIPPSPAALAPEKQNASSSSSEGQRVVPPRKDGCSRYAVPPEPDTIGVTSIPDACGALHGELTGGRDHEEKEHKGCVLCERGGVLLSCAGQGCDRSFHLRCVDPPFTYFPPGVWHCVFCVKKKMELGVYSVSEGIESILVADGIPDGEGMHNQYLVKYKDLAHVHSCWIAREKLILKAPAVLSKYKKNCRLPMWNSEWTKPQRLLAKRLLIIPEPYNSNFQKNDDRHYEWLVKWTGLDYNQASWELDDASFLSTPEGLKLINDFAIRQAVKEVANHAEENKKCDCLGKGGKCSYELPELPCGGPDHLNYVSKILECWHKDQNGLIIDSQERIVVVILFVLSLLKERSGPFLIVTTLNSLPLWEAEFRRWATDANVVVYEGTRDNRDVIRTLEFYNEGGYIMFQVLLSPSIVVIEDFENLKPIKWEVIVIDEFQRRPVSMHTEKIKMLAANMRLLVASSQMKDWSISYLNTLSLLDPNYEGSDENGLEDDGNIDSSVMKALCLSLVAYERKHEAVKLTEFWVPVMLSEVQNEQYCASLFSNSLFLCSYSKSDVPLSLRDLLLTARKCCDHPSLVDLSLRNSVVQDKPESDHYDLEIEMSGKLQLLDKILAEIKRRGLRVLILFQVVDSSGKISIGDILDDFVHHKFGRNSYSRIDRKMSRTKRRATLDVFNSKENGQFVCLIETTACVPSTKFSSVDTVVIFNSDWDPLSELKALKRMAIESQFEELKIFRLYSCYTVEEKALILAKEGLTVESSLTNANLSTCQKLLTWGSSWLFRQLDGSHDSSSPSLERTPAEDVARELSALLPCNSVEEEGSNGSSTQRNESNSVLSIQLREGRYREVNSYLVGELKSQLENTLSVDKQPQVFWKRLLEGKKPRWKYVHSQLTQLQRVKRKAEVISSLPEESEGEAHTAKESRRGPRRHRQVHIGGNNVTLEPAKEATVLFRRDAGKLQKAATLSVPPGFPTVESIPRPDVLPASIEHEDGDLLDSREGQNGHTNEVSGSCRLQATASTEGLARPFCNSVQQASRNLSPPPAAILPGIREPDTALVGSQVRQSELLASHKQEISELRKAQEEAVKANEDLKSCLEFECEKEMAKVRKKYDLLLQDAEAKMAENISELESRCKTINNQISVAEAMTLMQDDIPASDTQNQKQKEEDISRLVKDIDQLCSPPPVEGEKLAAASLQRDEISSSNIPIPMPPSEPGAGAREDRGLSSANMTMIERAPGIGLEHALAPFTSSSQRRPPSIASIRLAGVRPARPVTRGPAPHLRSSLPKGGPS